MSLATYIGCNVEIPINDEDSDNLITIDSCFSDEHHRINVKKYHFTTSYVYEVSSNWGIEISKYMNPISPL